MSRSREIIRKTASDFTSLIIIIRLTTHVEVIHVVKNRKCGLVTVRQVIVENH